MMISMAEEKTGGIISMIKEAIVKIVNKGDLTYDEAVS